MKKTYLISILILTLLFAVSSVSASENATDVSNALSDEIAVGNVEKISEDTAQALANDDSLKIQNAVEDDLIGDNSSSSEVIKSNSSLSASKVSGYSSFNTKFVAKLLIDGKQASGKKIVFSLNNKNYTRQTDAKGLATLNIQLPKGTYDSYKSKVPWDSSILIEEILVEPKALIPENSICSRLPGTDGKAKMSKSLGNCIYLSDDAETVRQKVMSMYTDPDHIKVTDPGKVEGNAVFTYLDAFSKPEHFAAYWPEYQNLDELKEHYQRGGLGDMKCKKFLNEILNEFLEPMRQRRHEFEQDIPEIYNILKKGTEKARETAAQTMSEVRAAMQINYFDDKELIQSQAERFRQK